MWSCEVVMRICTVIIWLLQNGLLDNWSWLLPKLLALVCLVRGLKGGRKGHMKTITYSGRCHVHTIASGNGIWAMPIGNFAQQFQS